MKTLITAAFIVAVTSFFGCNNATDHDLKPGSSFNKANGLVDAPVVKASFPKVNASVKSHVFEILGHYFHAKNALIDNEVEQAKNGATMLLYVIRSFDNTLMASDQKPVYIKYISLIKEQAESIIKSVDIEEERKHFAELSMNTYQLLKAFSAGKKIYYEFCPMAFNNKGANWLSESAVIQNPYFNGTSMNTCARIELVIE